jgi:multiple sugar transport system ATP-binding protein
LADIVVENAVKMFGDFAALKSVSLEVHDQEFMVLLGPSGCGKTTLLRAIAGLGMVDSGRVLIGGRDVTYLPPRQRNISMVFQSYAIFPHMKVYDNIAFGLRMKKVDDKETDRRVRQSAKMLHIENMLDRYPAAMSGGQRQRVAVARAIAVQAQVLLMDEPLSNLDALLRLEMRAELKRLLRDLKATTIYVTHDQIEAMSMGDRIAVMRDGEILQCDTPNKVYDTPANQFIGGFIGTPPMNFLTGQVQQHDGVVQVKVGDFALTPAEGYVPELKKRDGQQVLMGIRAENMDALSKPAEDALQVTVLVVEPLGSQNLLTIKIGDHVLKVSTHPDFPAAPDQDIWLRFPADKIRWMDYNTQQALWPQ